MDRFPRNKLTAVGLWCCTATLIVEAALTAQYVGTDSKNEDALRAAVAMIFCFQLGDTIMMNGKHRELW